jgi:hypothetical protein
VISAGVGLGGDWPIPRASIHACLLASEAALKRLLLATCVLLALTETAAHAAGINLTWSTGTVGCYVEKLTQLATWSCGNDTDGPWTFVASFKMDAAKTDFLGISAVVDGQSSSASLPDWWQFYNAGACRQTSLTTSADFTAAMKALCRDPFAGAATGGIGAWQTALYPPPPPLNVPLPNMCRLKVTYLLTTAKSLAATYEWYAFRATIDAVHTSATQPLCSGCTTPMCLLLNQITVLGSSSSYSIYLPRANNLITWQSSDPYVCAHLSTPAHNHTWGQVKSLYR